MRSGILAAFAALGCAIVLAGSASAEEPAGAPPCSARQDHARANGRSPQPTAQVAQEAQTGCDPGGQGPDASDKAGKDIDEMYDRLMRDSAEDLKGRPDVK